MSNTELNILCNSITLLSMCCLIFKCSRRYSLILFAISTGISMGFETIKLKIDWIQIGLSIIIFIVIATYILNSFDKDYNLKPKKNK